MGTPVDDMKKEFCAVTPCGGQKKAKNPPPNPAPPPHIPPPKDVLVILVIEEQSGKPVKGITLSASGSGKNLGNKTTNAAGLADFGKVDKGTSYTVSLKFSDADNKKYFASSISFNAVPSQSPGSPPFKITIKTRLLKIVSVDPQFAPGIEKLDIKYDIQGLADPGRNIILEISSDKYPGNKKIFILELLGAQKADGNGKLLSIEAKGNQPGPLKDLFFNPQFSPYKVILKDSSNNSFKDEKETKVLIDHLDLLADAPGDKLYMNDPARKVLITSKLFIKKKDGTAVLTPIGFEIFYTLTVDGANTPANASFIYAAPKTLGKKGDAAALYWEKHPDNEGFSTDGFKLKCSAKKMAFANAAEFGIVKTFFLPSGVGGDKFKIKSDYFAYNGTTSLANKETNNLQVWRTVTYEHIEEMQGLTHVSVNATEALIAPTFAPAFVKYTASARTELAAVYNVKYVGLWKDNATPQESWASVSSKKADETPTAAEILSANYAGADAAKIAQRNIDRNNIIAKAQKWVDRIDTAYLAAQTKWVRDAAIPKNSLIAIQYYHPKYSTSGGDSTTHEWNLYGAGTPAWLRVNTYFNSYHNIDPDVIWVIGGGEFGGLSIGDGRVLIPKFLSVADIQQSVKHETGHATKSFFKRQPFVGTDGLDHSASNAGIMYYTLAGGTSFTEEEKKVLRGIIP